MEVRWYVLMLIVGSALVTLLPRVLPLAVLSRLRLPNWAMQWLRHVPVAVMSALVAQSLLLDEGGIAFRTEELVAAFVTLGAAIWTRSLLWTVLAAMLSMMLLRSLL